MKLIKVKCADNNILLSKFQTALDLVNKRNSAGLEQEASMTQQRFDARIRNILLDIWNVAKPFKNKDQDSHKRLSTWKTKVEIRNMNPYWGIREFARASDSEIAQMKKFLGGI